MCRRAIDGSRIGAGARSGSSLLSGCFSRLGKEPVRMSGGIGGIGGGNVSGAARWQTYHRQMDRLRDRRDRLAVRRLDLVLVVTALGLLAVTAAFLVDKSLSF